MAGDESTPFRIEATDEELDDLRRRLRSTRWPDRETVDDWSQGIPLAYVQDLCGYWADGYDWRAREAHLNSFDQFRTTIDGIDIHFVHVRSPEASAKPLVITHGWPGSIVEFHKVIGPLTDPAAHGGDPADAFHVVCPSLPGYGFSGKPTRAGTGTTEIARLWSTLMGRLGYDRFLAQGGDWGSMVTTRLAQFHPETVEAVHLNMPIVIPDTSGELSAQEAAALEALGHYDQWDSGYSKQQSTRPQTLGYGLADSPAGQAAWIVEKFWAWTDNDGHPEDVLTRDELLDNVMLYWLPGTGASSARLYWESFRSLPFEPVQVPVSCSIFPKEIIRASERWARAQFGVHLHRYNELDKGGHFAAFEQPALYVDEVRAAFRAFR